MVIKFNQKLTLCIAICIIFCICISSVHPIFSKADKPNTVNVENTDFTLKELSKSIDIAVLTSDTEVFSYLSNTINNSLNTTSNVQPSNNIETSNLYIEDTQAPNSNTTLNKSTYYRRNYSETLTGTPSNSMPRSIDNSATKYFPPIMNQGNVGSCNSWATVYYQMTYTVNKTLDRAADNNKNIMSPTWVYTLTNKGINYGSYYSDVLKVLSEIGAVSVNSVPIITRGSKKNVCNIRAQKEYWLEASDYRIDNFYAIGPEIDTDITDPSKTVYKQENIDAIKKALSMGDVLTISTHNYRWKKATIKKHNQVPANNQYKGEKIITHVTGSRKDTHRMALVGYNDDIWVDINKNNIVEDGEKGAFKLASSWGTNQDNKGFIWMSYDALNVNSTLDTNKFRNHHRTVGFYNIIGFSVDLNNSNHNCYAAIDVQTKNLEAMNIEISAKALNGQTYTFNPAPFSLKNGLGPYPFNTKSGGDKGCFYIKLNNIIPNLTSQNIYDYQWNFTITNNTSKEDLTIHDFKIYYKNTNTYSNSIIHSPIVINNNKSNISF